MWTALPAFVFIVVLYLLFFSYLRVFNQRSIYSSYTWGKLTVISFLCCSDEVRIQTRPGRTLTLLFFFKGCCLLENCISLVDRSVFLFFFFPPGFLFVLLHSFDPVPSQAKQGLLQRRISTMLHPHGIKVRMLCFC